MIRIKNKKPKIPYFTTKYAFFCVFYFCFTALLFSQNTRNSFYVAANTIVLGTQNIHIKQLEKKQIAVYLTKNTLSYGLDNLTNTRLFFRTLNKKPYKKNATKALLKTRKTQAKSNTSNTHLRFSPRPNNPYSNTLGHGSNGFIALVTGQQKNTKRKNKGAVSKFTAADTTLKIRLKSTKKQPYPTTNTVLSSVSWFLSIYSRPPPKISC